VRDKCAAGRRQRTNSQSFSMMQKMKGGRSGAAGKGEEKKLGWGLEGIRLTNVTSLIAEKGGGLRSRERTKRGGEDRHFPQRLS